MQIDDHVVPIFSLYFDDGFRQGQGYFDVEPISMQIQSGSRVAETFVVEDTNHTVSQLTVRFEPIDTRGCEGYGEQRAWAAVGNGNPQVVSGVTQYVSNWFPVSFPQVILAKGAPIRLS